MPKERLTLQQGAVPVTVRHVLLGTGTGQQAVLQSAYVPAALTGVNGRRGWAQGQYTTAVYQEGQYQLQFPNAAGEDGQLHRDRFLVVAQGSRIAGTDANGFVTYGGGTYRPGDEWFELYRGSTLLFVGTPLGSTITRDSIQLQGADGLWLLKKARETQAGFWCNAPRDVFEYYTQVWYPRYATNTPVALANSAQVVPAGAAVDIGPASTNAHRGWRCMVNISDIVLGAVNDYVTLEIKAGNGAGAAYAQVYMQRAASTYIFYVRPHPSGQVAAKTWLAPQKQLALEIQGRERWLYYYVNGTLVYVQAMPAGTAAACVPVITASTTATCTVQQVLWRVTEPYLMRAAATNYVREVLRDGPAGYWRLNELTGTAIADSSGAALPAGALVGGYTLGAGGALPNDTSIAFNGTTGYATIPYAAALDTPAALTVEAEVYVGTAAGQQAIFEKTVGGVVNTAYLFYFETTTGLKFRVKPAVGGTVEVSYAWSNFTANTFYHVAGVCTGTNLYLYVNGVQVASAAYASGAIAVGNGIATIGVLNNGGAPFYFMGGRLDEVAVYSYALTPARIAAHYAATQPEPGEYRVPGSPPPGGLSGNYYRDDDLALDANVAALRLTPTRTPYASRIDSTVAFSAAGWYPPGPPLAKDFSVRWFGSIYLDLAATDIAVRLNPAYNGQVGDFWIGKTRVGEAYNTGATWPQGSSLRGIYGNTKGWYPILLEAVWSDAATGTPTVTLEYSTNGGGSWATVPATMLSPIGIYNKQPRLDSHYACLQDVYQTSGLQFTCVPQQLESGLFPGQVVPRMRVGRDTDYTIEVDDATNLQQQLAADQVADTLVVDASGIADPTGTSQLTAEAVNFAQLGQHLFEYTEYESLGDIDVPALLQMRAGSLLTLRGNVWEQVGVTPQGTRQLADTFPVTGAAAEFAWAPGDGARLVVPAIGVEDAAPRQILQVQWPIIPDGIGWPQVGFVQRPRGAGALLAGLQRQVALGQRNYQGQLVRIDGGLGSNNVTYAIDQYTRLPLPPNPADIVQVFLEVMFKSDGSTWAIDFNGTTPALTIKTPGRYDVTGIALLVVPTDRTYCYARLLGGGGTGDWVVQLWALVKV